MIPFHIPHFIFAAATFALIIPANTTDLRTKLKAAFTKKPDEGKKTEEDNSQLTRRTMSKVAQETAKRKALAAELADEKTSAARREEIIAGLTAQNEALQTELEEHKAKVEDLSPKAKKWSDFEHTERTKLLAMFPTEEQKDQKKIAEGMDIDTFRKYTQRVTGKGAGSEQGKEKGGKDGVKDWEKILSGDSAEAAKALEADPAGYNKYMDERGK